MNPKIKYLYNILLNELFVPLLIILSGITGFGLGRLSKIVERSVPITIENTILGKTETGFTTGQENAIETRPIQSTGNYVASKTGTKYHFPWCPGATRIQSENKIWFETAELARSAGYSPASNCKGID
ncbi:MAG: hypothetical protein HYS59_01545 [Candidatus Vogelbacteria bacterium]|nr:hypothetical protein [Candidatus Vogelbacteria bacterium]